MNAEHKHDARAADAAVVQRPDGRTAGESCDYCGAEALTWRKCKLICEKCGNIIRSCADL